MHNKADAQEYMHNMRKAIGDKERKVDYIKNNIHDKIFTCPKCGNDTLVPVDGNKDIIGIGYHDVCICEECAAELWSEPQADYTVKFVEIDED